jgi:hypothetical protein
VTLAIAVDIALAIGYRTGCAVDIRSDSQWISRRTRIRYRVALTVDIVLASDAYEQQANDAYGVSLQRVLQRVRV